MVGVGEITLLLREVEAGREGALDKLMTMVHADLTRMAQTYLHRQFGDRAATVTIEPAALVNESFMKLIRQRNAYDNRGQFFAIATRSMFRVLGEYRRKRKAAKRGGTDTHITLVLDERQVAEGRPRRFDLIEVEELARALEKLETFNPRKAEVVKMRVVWGLSIEAIADSLAVSRATVERDWLFAKAWLADEIGHLEP